MKVATKTLAAIDLALEADGAATYRGLLKKNTALLTDAFSTEPESFRTHLGYSLLGGECARAIWYSFRWFAKKSITGRVYRLFNRGHLEEARFVSLLEAAGIQVWQHDSTGRQLRVSDYKGHVGGSLDGVVGRVPDLPDGVFAVSEFKTHSHKSFEKVSTYGVKSEKFEHYVQMQMYMGKMKLPWALYGAVNKDNDVLYWELVPFDELTFARYRQRSVDIVEAEKAPPKLNESVTFFKCKFCDFTDVCHKGVQPLKNCRTCRFSAPVDGGQWVCLQDQTTISKEKQLVGCQGHEYIRG